MRKRGWTIEQLKKAVAEAKSYRQVLKFLNLKQAGGNYSQIKKYVKELSLDIKHFTGMGWNKGMHLPFEPKTSLGNILIENSDFQSHKLKNRLFKEGFKKPFCEECGWAKRAENGRLPLEIHHINGNSHDHRIENLVILCPNCHSLKPNYRGLNKKNK